ncbi:MAG: hypothetical protein IH914_01690 [candidate division Zixibacteria bacterium]|nr:hypothetical protein [candidate division Zixibacteria bacterium]
MKYLLVTHRVENFDRWKTVFDSHNVAESDTGLRILKLLRDEADPNMVVLFFEMVDADKALAFMNAPEAAQAKDDSGVIGDPTVMILSEAAEDLVANGPDE